MPAGPNKPSSAHRFLIFRFTSAAPLIAVALVAAATLAASAGVLLTPAGIAMSTHYAVTSTADRTELAASAQNKDSERIEAERITLRQSGFEPREISRPHGRFLLAFDDRSGLEDVTLSLSRQTGERMREVRFDKNKERWRETLNLAPGRYQLSVTNHPEWVCSLTITAR